MLRRLIPVTMLCLFLFPTHALAFDSQVEQWRPIVRQELTEHNVYSEFWEDKALSIMQRESGGFAGIRSRSGCVGLFQYTASWSRSARRKGLPDWRTDGPTSIHVFARTLQQGGAKSVKRHWRATW